LSGIDIATDVLGFPLATGWLLVSVIFGEWRAVHQVRSRWFQFSALLSISGLGVQASKGISRTEF
jgi:hypothetical protein